jgi:pyruvate/2-oxoglutarate dehydrogenase complex dihydrolipoamide acyltransferase (E2) component
MLGAILIVSGPTVVTPILRAARPGKRLTTILGFEGTTIDPVGAIIAVVVFQALKASQAHHLLAGLLGFAGRVGIGVAGGAAGVAVLWLLLKKLKLTGVLATQAIIATVITIAGLCDALQDDTGPAHAAAPRGLVPRPLAGNRTASCPDKADEPMTATAAVSPARPWARPIAAVTADEPARPVPAAGTADRSRSPATPRPGRAVRSWLLLILARPAAMAVWSGWAGIGDLTGFGQIRPAIAHSCIHGPVCQRP